MPVPRNYETMSFPRNNALFSQETMRAFSARSQETMPLLQEAKLFSDTAVAMAMAAGTAAGPARTWDLGPIGPRT